MIPTSSIPCRFLSIRDPNMGTSHNSGCFHVQEQHVPLDAVEPAGCRVGRRRVMAAHGVQETVTRRDADAPAAFRHGRAQRPLVGVRVEALDGAQARTAVPTPHHVQPVGLVLPATDKTSL